LFQKNTKKEKYDFVAAVGDLLSSIGHGPGSAGEKAICGWAIIRNSMKAYVTVMLKSTVLDPQGKTIQGALKKMGYKGVGEVRQGKFFELVLDGGLDKNAAKAEVERIAKEVLTNPVIEEFSYRLED